MAKDTTGGAVRVKRGSGNPAASLKICLRHDKPPTGLIAQNIAERDTRLEILLQSLKNYIEVGGVAKVLDMRPKFGSVAIILDGVATGDLTAREDTV